MSGQEIQRRGNASSPTDRSRARVEFCLTSIVCTFLLATSVLANDDVCYITNADFFSDQCPTLDPAFDEIMADFRITIDGVDVSEIDCVEPFSSFTTEEPQDALLLIQTLRSLYYLDKGKSDHLPWTELSLYGWLKSKIGGINISSSGSASCCGTWPNGDFYITIPGGLESPVFRRSEYVLGRISIILHEARHVDGFLHSKCCENAATTGSFACDLRYDESNLSPYGMQYWFRRSIVEGTLYTGYACLSEERVAEISRVIAFHAYNSGKSFCESPPPSPDEWIAASCLDCQPPDTLIAEDDGPYSVAEGANIEPIQNVLDNDLMSADAMPITFLGTAPAHASFFELRTDGSFDYTHDGSETTSDSFTYRIVNGTNESEEASVSIAILPINDAPTIDLIGSSSINLIAGESFVELGAMASDDEDGDISDRIVIGGNLVNPNSLGTYEITYDVTDTEGLAAQQVVRIVVISPAPSRKNGGGSGSISEIELLSLALGWVLLSFRRRALSRMHSRAQTD